MARNRTVFGQMMGVAMVAVLGATSAQAGGVSEEDVLHQLSRFKGELQAAREDATSAKLIADLALAETAAARICPTKCESDTELVDAQRKLVALGDQVRWIRSEYKELSSRVDGHDILFVAYGFVLHAMQHEIDATQGRVTQIEGWADEIEEWRQDKDEMDDLQNDAIVALDTRTRGLRTQVDDHEQRLSEKESVQWALWMDANVAVGGFSTDTRLMSGVAVPVFGGGGVEVRFHDGRGIWGIRFGAKGYHDFTLDDAGTCGHLGGLAVLNPFRRQDWSLNLSGEACRISTAKVEAFAKAERWTISPGFEVQKSWDVGRVRFAVGAVARASIGMLGTEYRKDEYINSNPFGVFGGLRMEVAIGSIWDRSRTGRFANVAWRAR